MKTIALFLGTLLCVSRAPADAAEPFSLRLITADGTINCLPDGSARVERPAAAQGRVILNLTHSPDARQSAFARDAVIYVGDANAEHAMRVSPEGLETAWPTWSPDGRRIAFLARRGGNVYQAHVVNRDGGDERQVTDAPHGVWQPRFGPDGRLAYLVLQERKTKLQPADLVVTDIDNVNKRHEDAVVRNVFINTYGWSPDGKTIAYSTYGSLVFHDLTTGKQQTVAYPDVDPRLKSHAAMTLAWRPDNKAVACTIQFLGGRQQGGPMIFGDHEVFVIPRDGKPSWFDAGTAVREIEWVEPHQE
jgi:Tol biopolymer transport system component